MVTVVFDKILQKLREKDSSGTAPAAPTSLSFTATCTSSEQVGDAVYLAGTSDVRRADASSISTAKVVGFISNKDTPTTCDVIVSGIVGNMSSLTAGSAYFLSETPGQITTTAPTAVSSVICFVGIALDDTNLVLMTGGNLTIRS